MGLWKKSAKILFLGLDNAGKTTLLGQLQSSQLKQAQPTMHSTHHELKMGNCTFDAHDIGGHVAAREDWVNHYYGVNAVIFIVDSADRGRLAEAKAELDKIMTAEQLSTVPVVILGNKIDIQTAPHESEFRSFMGLFTTTGKGKAPAGQRPVECFMCSVTKKSGYKEAFEWLERNLP